MQRIDEYDTLESAEQGFAYETNYFKNNIFPYTEYVFIGTIILKTNNTYLNDIKATIVSTSSGGLYLNPATTGGGSTFTPNHTHDTLYEPLLPSKVSEGGKVLAVSDDSSSYEWVEHSRSYKMDFTSPNWVSDPRGMYKLTIPQTTHEFSSKYLEVVVYETSDRHILTTVDVEILANFDIELFSANQYAGFLIIKSY